MKVLIGMPCLTGRPRIETLASVAVAVRELVKDGYDVEFSYVPDNWIAHSRNEICKGAFEFETDYVVMVDDDMGFSSRTIPKLIANDVDICAPLMHKRANPYDACAFMKREGEYKTIRDLKRDLVECDAVGGGVLVFKTRILLEMMPPFFASGPKTGEDVYFCANAKKHGHKVYYDGRIQVTHFGDPLPITTDWVMKVPGCPITLEEADA